MSYQLVIAEKPSVAMSYAKVLGATNRSDGYLEGNGYLVSWCIGHLSFFFLLSHPTALSCIRRADNAFNVWAVHQVLQDAELLLCGCRHKVLPLLRQDRQVSNAPLDIPLTVGIRRRKFHQIISSKN